MKIKRILLAALAVALQFSALAQTNAPGTAPEVHPNPALVPVPRNDWATPRQAQVLQRAKEAPGNYDIEFIGDSITQGWEDRGGDKTWRQYYGNRKAINFGVSGDRTQHVLWRFEQGQLEGIKAKVAVVMIGTNNSNNKDNTEAEILEGVAAIVQQIRTRQPETKIILCSIFPRGISFSPQRGKILQVNQALAKLDDGQRVFYLDFGSQFIERDGAISPKIMPDALHPNAAGYQIWAAAIEPKLKELLGEK